MLKVSRLNYIQGGRHILRDINYKIDKGDVVAIIGPSGAGKSSLIRNFALLDSPTSGEIAFEGKEIDINNPLPRETRMKIGMVFQEFTLFPHMTLLDNVFITPYKKKNLSKKESYIKAMEALRRVGLGEKHLRFPKEISSGEKQRGEIARSIALDPEIIFFDDPTSSLTPIGEKEIEAVIRELKKTNTTMVIATTSLALARNVANRVIFLVEGEIYEEGDVEEIFERPKRGYTRDFVNGLKSLIIDINSKDHDFIRTFSEIDLYCKYFQLSQTQTNHLLSAVEETVNILFRELTVPKIHMRLNYISQKEMTIMIDYNGEVFDIRDTKDLISLAILESAGEFLEYIDLDLNKGEYNNRIVYRVNG